MLTRHTDSDLSSHTRSETRSDMHSPSSGPCCARTSRPGYKPKMPSCRRTGHVCKVVAGSNSATQEVHMTRRSEVGVTRRDAEQSECRMMLPTDSTLTTFQGKRQLDRQGRITRTAGKRAGCSPCKSGLWRQGAQGPSEERIARLSDVHGLAGAD